MLTDYCTKGACNPDDQQFALAMGKQGIQESKHISLYAVSKAMGFIPRNKLGHKFFRCVAESELCSCAQFYFHFSWADRLVQPYLEAFWRIDGDREGMQEIPPLLLSLIGIARRVVRWS